MSESILHAFASKEIRYKAAYALAGFISLVVFFTVLYRFLAATAQPNNAGQIVVLGLTFYVFFYLWLYLLAKIVLPSLAFEFALGLSVVYFVFDILVPPYFITPQGQILTTGATWTFGASDVLVAEILTAMGVRGSALYWLTYVAVPTIVLFILVPIFWTRRRIAFALVKTG